MIDENAHWWYFPAAFSGVQAWHQALGINGWEQNLVLTLRKAASRVVCVYVDAAHDTSPATTPIDATLLTMSLSGLRS